MRRELLKGVTYAGIKMWLNADQMEPMCPKCASAMRSKNLEKMDLFALFDSLASSKNAAFSEGERSRWEGYWKSVGGSVTSCMAKVKGKFENEAAFCAGLKDFILGTPTWRKGRQTQS